MKGADIQVEHLFDLQLFAEGEGAGAGEQQQQGGAAGDGAQGTDAGQQDSGVLSGGEGQQQQDSGVLSGEGQKPGEEQKPGEGQKPGEEQKPEGAPEAYENFTFPEGLQIDEAKATEFMTVAKELNLSQANAQKLVDFQAKMVQEQQQGLIDAHKEMTNGWKAETLKAYTQEEISDAVRGFKAAPEGVQKLLSEFGLENNKDFVGFFANLGKSMKEDTFESGQQHNKEKSAAEVFYGGK